MNIIAIAKTRKRMQAGSREISEAQAIAAGNFAMLGGAAALIGIWSLACLVSAVVQSGPVLLARNLLTAVTGI